MLLQKETAPYAQYRTLLRITAVVVLFLSLGLLVMGFDVSRDEAISRPGHHGATPSVSIMSNAVVAGPTDSGAPVMAGAGVDEFSQRKLLAVMLTALAAALLWLWRELPTWRQSRQRH